MFADGLEHLADKTLRSPVRHDDAATRSAYPHQFSRDPIRLGCKHCADETDHQVKRVVVKSQHFGVTFVKTNSQGLGLGARTRLLDLLGEVLTPGAPPQGPAASSAAVAPAEDPLALWQRSQAGVAPLKRKR